MKSTKKKIIKMKTLPLSSQSQLPAVLINSKEDYIIMRAKRHSLKVKIENILANVFTNSTKIEKEMTRRIQIMTTDNFKAMTKMIMISPTKDNSVQTSTMK